MKIKIVLSFWFCCLFNISNGQTSVNFNLGINSSFYEVKNKDSTFSDDFNRKLGFNFGPSIQIKLNDNFLLQTGLIGQMRGYRQTTNLDSVTKLENKHSFYYLDIPLLVNYQFPAKNSIRYFVSFGPYSGIALGGRNKKITSRRGQVISENKTRFTIGNASEKNLNTFDFGLTLGGGVKFKKFNIGLFYDYGVSNTSPDKENGLTAKNRVLRATITLKSNKNEYSN